MREEKKDGSRAPRESLRASPTRESGSAVCPDRGLDFFATNDSDLYARELEAQLLQLLCQIPAGVKRAEIFERFLSAPCGYHWRIPEHEVIFQALARVPQLSGPALQTMLPAQLTRAGFPDIEIAPYFASLNIAEGERDQRAKQIADALIANPILK